MLLEDEQKTERPTVPAGMHTAWLYRIVDMGTQKIISMGQESNKRRLRFTWELPDETMEDGRPLSIDREYTYSLFKQSTLAKDILSWTGSLPGEKFDTKPLFDTPCNLNVAHKASGERTYANVVGIAPLKKGEVPKPRHNPIVTFSLRKFDQATFNSFPAWLQDKIRLAPEYAEAMGIGDSTQMSA